MSNKTKTEKITQEVAPATNEAAPVDVAPVVEPAAEPAVVEAAPVVEAATDATTPTTDTDAVLTDIQVADVIEAIRDVSAGKTIPTIDNDGILKIHELIIDTNTTSNEKFEAIRAVVDSYREPEPEPAPKKTPLFVPCAGVNVPEVMKTLPATSNPLINPFREHVLGYFSNSKAFANSAEMDAAIAEVAALEAKLHIAREVYNKCASEKYALISADNSYRAKMLETLGMFNISADEFGIDLTSIAIVEPKTTKSTNTSASAGTKRTAANYSDKSARVLRFRVNGKWCNDAVASRIVCSYTTDCGGSSKTDGRWTVPELIENAGGDEKYAAGGWKVEAKNTNGDVNVIEGILVSVEFAQGIDQFKKPTDAEVNAWIAKNKAEADAKNPGEDLTKTPPEPEVTPEPEPEVKHFDGADAEKFLVEGKI